MQISAQQAGSGTISSSKWLIALAIVFGLFASIMDTTIVNIAIPHLQSAFGGSLTDVQWVLTGYTLSQAVATPLTPYLASLLGTKRLYLVALSIFMVFSTLCGLSWNLSSLIFFRILQGVGAAFLMPIAITLLYSVFPPQERGMAMGVLGIPVLFAPALGPTLGGYLITFASWQLIFYINIPICIIGIIAGAVFLQEVQQEVQTRFDVAGFLFSALGLASIIYAFSQVSSDGWDSATVIGFLSIGFSSLIIFVFVELDTINRGLQPLLNLRVFADRAFTPATIAMVFITFILFGGLFMVPIYLQSLRGLSAYQSGLLLLPQALVSVVVALIGGWLTDKVGTLPVIIPGLLFLIYPLWGLSFITSDTPYGWFQTLLVLRGLEIGLVFQPLMRAALVRIPEKQMNDASSVSTMVRLVTVSLSTAILSSYVQTQQKIHYTHLAEQFVPGTPKAQFISTLQIYFQTQGMNLASAYNAAILSVIHLVQQQSYALALQDGFRLTLWMVIPALFILLLLPAELRKPATNKKHPDDSIFSSSI